MISSPQRPRGGGGSETVQVLPPPEDHSHRRGRVGVSLPTTDPVSGASAGDTSAVVVVGSTYGVPFREGWWRRGRALDPGVGNERAPQGYPSRFRLHLLHRSRADMGPVAVGQSTVTRLVRLQRVPPVVPEGPLVPEVLVVRGRVVDLLPPQDGLEEPAEKEEEVVEGEDAAALLSSHPVQLRSHTGPTGGVVVPGHGTGREREERGRTERGRERTERGGKERTVCPLTVVVHRGVRSSLRSPSSLRSSLVSGSARRTPVEREWERPYRDS